MFIIRNILGKMFIVFSKIIIVEWVKVDKNRFYAFLNSIANESA